MKSSELNREHVPTVSVVLPIYNEAPFIRKCLEGILVQDYPADLTEILIADGGSNDSTLAILEEIILENPSRSIRIIPNPERTPGSGTNKCITESRSEIICRIDGHTEIPKDYVAECVNALLKSGAENVGGRIYSAGHGLIGEATALATTSRFGNGGARFRYSPVEEFVDTVPFGAWKRSLFERVGLFREDLRAAEDDEFNYRLRKSGGRIYYSPRINSRYFTRDSLPALWKQYFAYGLMKVSVMRLHPQQMQPRHFIPAAFVASAFVLAGLSFFFKTAAVVGLALAMSYLVTTMAVAVGIGWRKGLKHILVLPAVFATLHFSYALGFLRSLILTHPSQRQNRIPTLATRSRETAPAPNHLAWSEDIFLKPPAALQHQSLGVFSDIVFVRQEETFGCHDAFFLFLLGLEPFFHKVAFCSRLAESSPTPPDYLIPPRSRIEFCPLPAYESVANLLTRPFKFLPSIWTTLRESLPDWDLVWLTWPHPISLIILIYLRLKGRSHTCFLAVRQNFNEQMKSRYTGLARIAAVSLAGIFDWTLKICGRDVPIFTVGDEMFQKYRRDFLHVYPIEMSLISIHDLPSQISRTPKEPGQTSRMLFVGRLDKEKALPLLVQTLEELTQDNRAFHLDLVGVGTEEHALRDQIRRLGLENQVTFHGYVRFGPALFELYKSVDMFVLPSLSEGLPQVLLEAMAFGIPIVATRVGGIPGIIRHEINGLLVEPGSVAALVAAVKRLSDEPGLADRLGRNGWTEMRPHTKEHQLQTMALNLAGYFARSSHLQQTVQRLAKAKT